MGKHFKHNEKTDFIVNMTSSGYQKLVFWFLAAAAAVTSLSFLPYYLKRGNDYISGGLETAAAAAAKNAQSLSALRFAPIALMAFGFFGFLMLIIAGLKKYFRFGENKGMFLAAAYLLICGVSAALSGNKMQAVFGADGRYEGLIAIVAYLGIFAAGCCLWDKQKRKLLANVIIALAAFHSVVGLLQTLPFTRELVPTFFGEYIAESGNVMYENFAANGFLGSPFTLAATCSAALGLALNGLMQEDKRPRRAAYFAAAAVICAAGFASDDLAALVGIAAAFLIAAIVEIIRIRSGNGLFVKGILKNPLGRWLLCLIIAAAELLLLKLTGIFYLNDAYIAETDSFYRLMLSRPIYQNTSGAGVYPHMWKETLSIFKDHWLFGTGSDCVAAAVSPDAYTVVGLPDKAYNEYITMAASTGVISLAFYLGFLAAAARRGAKKISGFFAKNDNWVSAGAFTACGAYLAQALFSASAINSAPVFFLLVGLCFGGVTAERELPAKTKKK